MKLLTTMICVLAFAVMGVSLAISDSERASIARYNTVQAATMPLPIATSNLSKLQTISQLSSGKEYTKIDTVFVPQEFVVVKDKSKVNNPKPKRARTLAKAAEKRMGLSIPAVEPDTAVKNQVRGDREEYTPDTIGPPKGSICLTVDGEVVYKR